MTALDDRTKLVLFGVVCALVLVLAVVAHQQGQRDAGEPELHAVPDELEAAE